jgi:hypothetical protein
MIRLKEFSSRGQDSTVSDTHDGGPLGNNNPIEVRFTVWNDSEHYPGSRAQCGAGSQGIVLLTDLKHYCEVLFGNTMVASGSPFVDILSPSGDKTIPIIMYESDNGPLPARMVEINLDPEDWYVPECRYYTIVVWKAYNGNGRGVCYETDGEGEGALLNLNIPNCAQYSFPTNNFYIFKFQVTSPNLPPPPP